VLHHRAACIAPKNINHFKNSGLVDKEGLARYMLLYKQSLDRGSDGISRSMLAINCVIIHVINQVHREANAAA